MSGWASTFYATRTPDEAYGPGWQERLRKAEPAACPPWCTVSHGVPEDLFRNLVTEDECVLHELDLAKEGDFTVGLVQSQHHAGTGKPTTTHLWLTHGGNTFGVFTVAGLRALAAIPGVHGDLVTAAERTTGRLLDLRLAGAVDDTPDLTFSH